MKKVISVFLTLILLVGNYGCAMRNPDMSTVSKALTREEVEKELGSPIKSQLLENGERVDTYEYTTSPTEMWKEGIGDVFDVGRELAVITLPLWLPFFLNEAPEHQIRIIYDKDDNVAYWGRFDDLGDNVIGNKMIDNAHSWENKKEKFKNQGIKTSEGTGSKYGFAP